MKKLKGIVLLIFCCLFSGVVALSACSPTEETKSASVMLDSIAVDASGAKTEYAIGEEFSSEGIVVTAETSINNVSQDSITVTDYTVDSSAYNSLAEGEYTIYISYALSENTSAVQHAEYTVTVSSNLPVYANMEVEYTGDLQLSYLTSGVSIDLSSDKITVTSHTGNDAANLTDTVVTDYTLYYSVNGGTETKVTGSSVTATQAGTYSFYAVKTYTVGTESTEMRAQFVVYVVDEATSLTKNEGGTTEYSYGALNIGSDWTYTLTFASGATETLDYDDVEITADSDTSGSQTANVSYLFSYTGIKNDEVATISSTLTTTVDITVAEAVFGATIGFLTEALSSVDDFTAVSYDAGDTIATNDVFTLTSTVATTTSIGKNSNVNYLLQEVKSGNTFSFTDMDDNSFSPDQGIKMSSAISASKDSGTVFTLTATKACKVQLYVLFANDSYNSDRAGTIYYAVDGGTAIEKSVSKRTETVTITVTLTAGQELTIGAVNKASSDAKLWLFGAQAQAIS